jgi:hypothetical protein
MTLDKFEPDKSEGELIDLVRRNDAQNFTLTIASDRGRWRVTTVDLDTGGKLVGEGASFTEAWAGQKPSWAGR